MQALGKDHPSTKLGAANYARLLREHVPDDPALALMSIDSNLMRKDFEGAREAVRSLKKTIPDPYLDFYIGYVELHAEQYSKAEACARRFLESDPDDIEGYELLLEVGSAQERHEMTAEALTALESDHEMDYSGVFESEDWQSFVMSAAGKQWVAARRQ